MQSSCRWNRFLSQCLLSLYHIFASGWILFIELDYGGLDRQSGWPLAVRSQFIGAFQGLLQSTEPTLDRISYGPMRSGVIADLSLEVTGNDGQYIVFQAT